MVNKKFIFSIIIGIIVAGLIVMLLEKRLDYKFLLMGIVPAFFISLSIVTQVHDGKSPGGALLITVAVIVFIYLLWIRIHDFRTYLSAACGMALGVLVYYGWILSYRPFSRKEYLKKQRENRKGG